MTAEVIPAEVPASLVPRTPDFMLDRLIEQKADPETIGKMMDLYDRWRADTAKREFTVAMNLCQAEMPTIVRDKENAQTRKKYAPLETIKTWSKPHFIKHGFALSFTCTAGDPSETTNVHLDTTHVGGHTMRTTIPNCELDDKGPQGGPVKTQIQGRMSTLAYAQGRLICLAFNLTVADEDRDGQASTITPEQIGIINGVIEECEQADRWAPGSMARILSCYKVASLDDLPANRFLDLMADMDRQRTGKVGVKR